MQDNKRKGKLSKVLNAFLSALLFLWSTINVWGMPSRVNRTQAFAVHWSQMFGSYALIYLGEAVLHRSLAITLAMVVILFYIASAFALVVKRLYDLNMSDSWLLVLLIPIVGSIFGLYVLFAGGTKGANRFGPEPKPANRLACFLAFSPLFIMLFLWIFIEIDVVMTKAFGTAMTREEIYASISEKLKIKSLPFAE